MSADPIRGIIFDKDGTLFDFTTTWEAWAVSFLLRGAGGDRDRAVRIGHAIGFDLDARRFATDSVVIAGTPGEIALALLPHFDMALPDLIDLLNTVAEDVPQAEAVPLAPFLAGLRRRGLRLGVATNDGIEPAIAHLEKAGIVAEFDFIAGFDSGHGSKPLPGQLHAFCVETGLRPAEVVMVGDSLHDLHAGRAAGMRTVGVLTGMAGKDDLHPHADIVLPDIGHLPAWIDSTGGAKE